MTTKSSLLCTACGRTIAAAELARGACPHCGHAHGLGADDAAFAAAILQAREAAEAEREAAAAAMTATSVGLGRRLFASHPLGFLTRFFVREGETKRDYLYLASLRRDGAYLDLRAPLPAARADLERAHVDVELALWLLRLRQGASAVVTRTRFVANPKYWPILFFGVGLQMAASGSLEFMWVAWLGMAITYSYIVMAIAFSIREQVAVATNQQAPALARAIDHRLQPRPLAGERALMEWLANRWAAPLDAEFKAARAGVTVLSGAVEALLVQAPGADDVSRLIVHVPFLCAGAPTSIQRRAADAFIAELASRGWRVDVDDKVGVRAALSPVGREFSAAELAGISDDLRRLCAIPGALGGTSSCALVTEPLTRADGQAIHAAMRRHHASNGS